MNNEIILIFSRENDTSTELVSSWIHKFGYKFHRFSNNFSSLPNLTISFGQNNTNIKFLEHRVKGVWLRKNPPIKTIKVVNQLDVENHINEEVTAFKRSFIAFIKHCDRIVLGNNFSDESFDVNKIRSLLFARKVKIKIPETILTNDKSELLNFIKLNKKVIIKPISNPTFFRRDIFTLATYTSILTENDLQDFPEDVFPCFAQKYISKQYELRLFYIDKKIYCSAIFSQLDEQTKIDFRVYNKSLPNRVVPYNLPKHIQLKIALFMDSMGLNTGSIDMIRSGNSYYFLEVNPVGNYDMISFPCNFHLDEIIAQKLCQVNLT